MLHVDGRKHALDVSLLPTSSPAAAAQPPAGTLVLGRLTAVGGGIGGVRVQLSARSTGRVHLADIHDAPVQQALAGLKAGQYCRAAVLGPDPAAPAGGKRKGGDGAQLLLSLRPSAGGQCAAHAAAHQQQQQKGEDTPQVVPGPLKAEQLKPGQRVSEGGNLHSCLHCSVESCWVVHRGRSSCLISNLQLPASHFALAPNHLDIACSMHRWLDTSSWRARRACL